MASRFLFSLLLCLLARGGTTSHSRKKCRRYGSFSMCFFKKEKRKTQRACSLNIGVLFTCKIENKEIFTNKADVYGNILVSCLAPANTQDFDFSLIFLIRFIGIASCFRRFFGPASSIFPKRLGELGSNLFVGNVMVCC